MIKAPFFGTIKNVELKKARDKTFAIVHLETVKTGQNNEKTPSVWEFKVWGKMVNFLSKATPGDVICGEVNIEMRSFEWQGKTITKPEFSLARYGFVPDERNVARTPPSQPMGTYNDADLPF